MKVFFALVAASLAFAGWVNAQPSNSASTNGIGPRIAFNSENYDFVKVLAGDPVKYSFFVTNTGDATLDINSAKGTCSCTVVGQTSGGGWVPRHLEPGQSCEIPVEVATINYAGQTVNKQVIVASNDPKRPLVTLQIHGAVWEPIQVVPGVAFFTVAANSATNSTQVIKIYNRTDTPLVLSDPVCTTNAFTFTLITNVPGQEFQLTINAAPVAQLPPVSGVRTLQGMISIKTSVPLKNSLNINLLENIMPEVTVYPAMIQVPTGPLFQALTNHITIRDDSANIVLSNATANVPGIETSIVTIQTNRQYYLNVVFPKDFEIPVGQAVALTVNTDNPRFPVLTVPVTAMRPLVPNRNVPPPARTAVLPNSIRTNIPGRGNSP
jgi:hypothetical protein